jgi:hypothetical protein
LRNRNWWSRLDHAVKAIARSWAAPMKFRPWLPRWINFTSSSLQTDPTEITRPDTAIINTVLPPNKSTKKSFVMRHPAITLDDSPPIRDCVN